ncbi:MAG: hypothetical protein H2057_04020 [Alphaproteobacteria bacterium]|nr:hypothetical protein [Alphaproteobacteria bacterium]
MRKFFCSALALASLLPCFIVQTPASDDETDFYYSGIPHLRHTSSEDEVQTQDNLSTSEDEEGATSTFLMSSLDAETLLPPGLLCDSGTFALKTPASPPQDLPLATPQSVVKYRYPLDPGRESLCVKQSDFAFCKEEDFLGYAWFLNQKKVPLYRDARYGLSDGAEIIYVLGSEVEKAGKRVRGNLNLLHVIDLLRHVWSYNGPITAQPYTFLTQGNAFFPYFHVGRTFGKKTYAALRIGKTWYALKKNAQINFQYITSKTRSNTQKVSAREFAKIVKEKYPVFYAITQVKKKRKGKFEVVYRAN